MPLTDLETLPSPTRQKGSPERVCFIMHPTTCDPSFSKRQVAERFPRAAKLPAWFVHDVVMPLLPPSLLVKPQYSRIVSPTGATVELLSAPIPLDPRQIQRNPKRSIERIIETALEAQRYGIRLVGLGAYTKIVRPPGGMGGGVEIADRLRRYGLHVTNGNSLTAGVAAISTLQLAALKGWALEQEKVAVIGARGSTGNAITSYLAKQGCLQELLLVGSSPIHLSLLEERAWPTPLRAVSLEEACRSCRTIISVTSSTEPLQIDPSWLQPGALVCDAARPRDFADYLEVARPDVLAFDGAVVRLPSGSDPVPWCGLDVPACLAELLLMGLEGWEGDGSLGHRLEVRQIEAMLHLFNKHGFAYGRPRRNEQPIPDEILRQHGIVWPEP